ncbi:ESCRT-II complex subunit-domain-containing protein [Xylaria sp. CBS 124048]|nr:ESCRT-II complex subunit-domain-containing protein [Xylaria sp. CBS 124048]
MSSSSSPSPDTSRQSLSLSSTAPTIAATTTTNTTINSTTTSSTTYRFPAEHAFPPFYTRQPNQSTRRSQHQKWAAIILSYCAHHRLFKLSLSSPAGEALFHNRQINRRLSAADVREVLELMRRDGRVEFAQEDGGGGGGGGGNSNNNNNNEGGGDVVWVYWRTPDEWAALVEAWVDDTAQKGSVFTLYELCRGDDTIGTEFHGLDLELLQKALQVLVKRGKAQIFGQEDQLGVKFF